MKTRIHVNQHNIRANAKNGTNLPVLTVKDYKQNRKCNEVVFKGEGRVIYSPDKPLSCGAKVWIETDDDIEIISQKTLAIINKRLYNSLETQEKYYAKH